MFNNIKSTLQSPEFQRKAAHAVGGIVSFTATVIVSHVISKAIEAGVDAIMDKIQGTTESTEAE